MNDLNDLKSQLKTMAKNQISREINTNPNFDLGLKKILVRLKSNNRTAQLNFLSARDLFFLLYVLKFNLYDLYAIKCNFMYNFHVVILSITVIFFFFF